MSDAKSMTSIFRRTIVAVIGVALGVGLVGLAGTDGAHANTTSDRRVFVEGDSLTVGASPYLKRYLRGHVRSVTVDAQVGRFTPTGIAHLNSPAARRANIWVVALGTNDGPDPARTKAWVSRVMRLAGHGRQVIWVNVVRPGGYQRVNTMLAQLDARYDNLSVLDWARYIRHNRALLSGDNVHLTARGYQLRALEIRRAIDAL